MDNGRRKEEGREEKSSEKEGCSYVETSVWQARESANIADIVEGAESGDAHWKQAVTASRPVSARRRSS